MKSSHCRNSAVMCSFCPCRHSNAHSDAPKKPPIFLEQTVEVTRRPAENESSEPNGVSPITIKSSLAEVRSWGNKVKYLLFLNSQEKEKYTTFPTLSSKRRNLVEEQLSSHHIVLISAYFSGAESGVSYVGGGPRSRSRSCPVGES